MMNLKPKTQRRLAIVILGLLLICGALGGLYLFRKHQIHERTLQARADGLAAFKDGDYPKALDALSRYNSRIQNDPETLFAFGKARSRIETPNNRHLAEAIQYFRRGLEFQPDNGDAQHALLELYTNPFVQYNAEASALAESLLAKNPSDVVALRAKARSLYRLRKFEPALAASEKLNELSPLDVEGQRITYELLYHLKRPSAEILDRAKKAREARPEDPRFQLLQGFAFLLAGDSENANQWLRTAAKNNPPDAAFVRELTALFDQQRLYDDSDALLERAAAAAGSDPQMKRLLIQRLWQNGRYAEAVKRLENLDPKDTGADSQLLAYRAFCLYQLGKDEQAKPITAALANRTDDDIGLAWSKALRTRFESLEMSARDQISQYQGALVRDPSNPVIRYMIGEAYARLGETEPALQAWRLAAEQVPSWSMPRTRIAHLLAASGRGQSAVDEAINAYNRSQNVGTAIGLATAWYAKLSQSDDPALRPKVLGLAKEIQTKLPGEPETLPIYVDLLARENQRDAAIKVINDTLAAKQAQREETLLQLVNISRVQRLGLESAILDKAQQLKGNTPAIALSRALNTAAAGKSAEAPAALKAAAQAANMSGAKVQWDMVIAEFLQRTGDAGAKDAWVALGEANPKDVAVQNAIVNLPDTAAVWNDRPFMSRTIDRLRDLTGEEGTRWQLARARWLLTSDAVDRDSAQAVVLLTDLVRTSPNLLAPRLYLARAFENVKNPSAAIEQLKAAAEADPDSATIALQLARLLQDDGKYDEAKVYLNRVSRSAMLDSQSRLTIAATLAQQGDAAGAIALLESAPPSPDTNQRDLLLASLYRRAGQNEKADPLLSKLMAQSTPSIEVIAASADFSASQGKVDDARKTLARLDDPALKLKPEQRLLILADFESTYGKPADALANYRRAVDAAPKDANVWRALVNHHVRQNDLPAAASAASLAIAAVPGDSDLQTLQKQLTAMQANGGRADINALADALAGDPRNIAAVESLAVINDAQRTKEPPDQTADKLRLIANRNPRFVPLQKLLVQMYVKLGKFADAEAIAQRTSHLFPTSPESAQIATSVYAASGKWTEMLTAAEQWRARSLSRPIDADLAIAQARSQIGGPDNIDKAVAILEPYVAQAKTDPDNNVLLLTSYARALLLAGRDKDAATLLSPMLGKSAQWKTAWLRLSTQVLGADSTAAWIERLAGQTPETAPLDDRFNIADAWYNLALRYSYRRGWTEAQKILTPLVKTPDVPAKVPLLLGAVNEKLDDRAGAIAAYRQALKINPNIPVAQNNLAYQLCMANESLDEAQDLAEKAVKASPKDGGYLDTLARVYAKRGDKQRALETFKQAAELSPNDIQTQIGLAQTLLNDGKSEPAHEVFERIESLARADPAGAASVRQDLEALRAALK